MLMRSGPFGRYKSFLWWRFTTYRKYLIILALYLCAELPSGVSTLQSYRVLGNSINVRIVAALLKLLTHGDPTISCLPWKEFSRIFSDNTVPESRRNVHILCSNSCNLQDSSSAATIEYIQRVVMTPSKLCFSYGVVYEQRTKGMRATTVFSYRRAPLLCSAY